MNPDAERLKALLTLDPFAPALDVMRGAAQFVPDANAACADCHNDTAIEELNENGGLCHPCDRALRDRQRLAGQE